MTKQCNQPVYTISTAAELAGISVHTLRMYEKEGLIIPFKKSSNQRLYSDKDIERIQCIRKTINTDKMTIEGIRRMLSLIPCWALMNCFDEAREFCEVYNSHDKPCWMMNRELDCCNGRECIDCEVYQSFSNCQSIKNKLKELLK